MGKQGRLFAIATLVIAIVFLHSGKALECYQCNSLDDEGCESGPLEDYIVDCSATTTTEPTTPPTAPPTTPPPTAPPTTPPPTAPPTTPPSTASPTTSPTASPTTPPSTASPTTPPSTAPPTTPPSTASPTTPPSTASPTTPPSTASPTTPPSTASPTTPPSTASPTTQSTAPPSITEPDDKNSENSSNNIQVRNVRNRQRRSILRSFAEDKPEWACAVIKQNLENNIVIVRQCVLNTVEGCPSSVINNTEVDKCVEFQKCNTDKCNSATAVSINTTILGFLVLSWTAFTFIN